MTAGAGQWVAEWLTELLDTRQAIRWPCGHIGMRRHDPDDEPDRPYYEHRCGCELPGRLGEVGF